MMNYDNFEDILNQTVNMTEVFNGAEDDGVRSFVGVDWFTFNGRNILSSYFSGNHWLCLGTIGTIAEHLKPFRRDGKAYKFYREEGMLFNYYRFLKVRWEGYVVYSSTTDANQLIYEVIFFDNQSFYLNIIKTPATDRSATTLVSNKTYTIDLNQIVDRTLKVSFYAQNGDETGNDWIVSYEPFVIEPPHERRYLLSSNDTYYTITDDELLEVEIVELNAQSFLDFGFTDIPPSDILKTLANPKVLFWQESEEHDLPTFQANITAIPPIQVIEHTVDMSDETIKGINTIEVESVGSPQVSFSKEEGAWVCFNGTEWVEGYMSVNDVVTTLTGDVLDEWRGVNKYFKVRLSIAENDAFKKMKFNFKN